MSDLINWFFNNILDIALIGGVVYGLGWLLLGEGKKYLIRLKKMFGKKGKMEYSTYGETKDLEDEPEIDFSKFERYDTDTKEVKNIR